MKQFFKFLFASCLGTLLAFGAIFFLLIIFSAALGSKETTISKNSVLLLELDNPIPEISGNVETSPYNFEKTSSVGVHRICQLIDAAREDKNIKGIVYKTSMNTAGGMVTHSKIRQALSTFKDSSEKFVYSYGDFYSNASYLIASATDSIFINPNGFLDINGYAAMIPFFKEMMDKVGVKMNVFYAGNFKSATEPFRRKEMSEANRQQTREYLNDNFSLYIDEVCKSRKIDKSQLNALLNNFELDNIETAIQNDIIDGKWQWFEMENHLRSLLDLEEGKKINYVDIAEYDSKKFISKGLSDNKIAVVFAEGDIVYDSNEKGFVSEVKFHKIFDKIRKNDDIKALVLRVNSPGGSAFSSDVIYNELKSLQAKGIPVIASFGDYAASGGYYIAAAADTIVSHPKTLTGSIGVFSMMPDVTEMMNDKIGIHFDTIKTSPYSVGLTPFFKFSEDEKEGLQRWTDNLYNKFVSLVAEGRGMSYEEVHAVAQGRVWTGQRAIENGLVDVLGDLDDAIKIAAERVGIEDDYSLKYYPFIKKEFFEELLESLPAMDEAQAKMRQPSLESVVVERYKDMKSYLQYREPMAKLPFILKY